MQTEKQRIYSMRANALNDADRLELAKMPIKESQPHTSTLWGIGTEVTQSE